MEICFGMIGMRPKDFWNSSPKEIYNAVNGFIEFNSSSEKTESMTKDRLAELQELYPD
tara:strand:+ start:2711 stop:2884 length:174 start_codon:yes stop_codon:yes gene_type:complete